MMTTHELARILLETTDRKVEASLDTSTSEKNAHERVFSSDLYGIQENVNAGTVTLLFEEAWSNNDV